MKNGIKITLLLLIISQSLTAQVQTNSNFTESEITLNTVTGGIYGTLTTPVIVKESPVVLIIAGSGPTDRDCNSPMGIKTNAYKMLAESFAVNGISTLRYDKRGIAKSKAAMVSESDIRFDNYINDAAGWIDLLKKAKPDADRQKNIATYSYPGLSLKQGLTEALSSFIKGIK